MLDKTKLVLADISTVRPFPTPEEFRKHLIKFLDDFFTDREAIDELKTSLATQIEDLNIDQLVDVFTNLATHTASITNVVTSSISLRAGIITDKCNQLKNLA